MCLEIVHQLLGAAAASVTLLDTMAACGPEEQSSSDEELRAIAARLAAAEQPDLVQLQPPLVQPQPPSVQPRAPPAAGNAGG